MSFSKAVSKPPVTLNYVFYDTNKFSGLYADTSANEQIVIAGSNGPLSLTQGSLKNYHSQQYNLELN